MPQVKYLCQDLNLADARKIVVFKELKKVGLGGLGGSQVDLYFHLADIWGNMAVVHLLSNHNKHRRTFASSVR